VIHESIPLLDEEHRLLDEVLTRSFGLTFPPGRRELLRLRLEPRLRELKLRRFMDYYLLLQCDGAAARKELWHLAHRVTNNETYFFREIEPISALYRAAVTDLDSPVGTDGELRVLCAGCSSGEEAYTLAILARENRCSLAGLSVEVHAFDVDCCRLRMAQRAVYGPSSLRAVEAGRLGCYFEPVDDTLHRLRAELRQKVHFFEANIVRPDTYCRAVPYDVVFCRNVLIYFSEESIRRAVACFARVMRPGGLLFLGHAESIIGIDPAFEAVRLGRSIAYRFLPGRR
jgi:chemotaxis protein methyltransferase CheR